jgi:hypothetical protein
MGLLRAVVWCLVVLLILVPTVRLAPSAGDQSHHASMKSSRASPGVGRTTAATPSVVAVLPILTPESLDVPGARDRLVSVDPTVPFVPPRG